MMQSALPGQPATPARAAAAARRVHPAQDRAPAAQPRRRAGARRQRRRGARRVRRRARRAARRALSGDVRGNAAPRPRDGAHAQRHGCPRKDGEYAQMSHDGPVGSRSAISTCASSIVTGYRRSRCATRPRTAVEEPAVLRRAGPCDPQVYLRAHSDHAAYDAFVERWRAPSQEPGLDVAPPRRKRPSAPTPRSTSRASAPRGTP